MKRILIIGIVVFAFIFIAAYAFMLLQGKAIVAKQLENITHKKATIGSLSLGLPLNLTIRNLNIEGLAKAEYVSISPSILGFLTGNVVLNNLSLIKPELIYERIPSPTSETAPTEANTVATAQTGIHSTKKEQRIPLVFKQLSIKDGKLIFTDHTVSGQAMRIIIKDLDFNLSNLYIYPRSVRTNFQLRGKIPWQQGEEEGKVEAEGWLDLFKKDMQATIKITDIDGISLYPYYANWVDLEKARIERAKLNWTSNIKSVNNNLTADCHLELTDIAFKPRPQEEGEDKAEKIAAVVMDIFKALNKGKVVLNFTIRTKMTNPQFGFNDIKDAFETRLAEGRKNNDVTTEIVQFPAQVVKGTVKSATDLSRAFIDGALTIGNGLKEAIKVAFKRERTK